MNDILFETKTPNHIKKIELPPIIIKVSKRKDKKYVAIFEDEGEFFKIHFGNKNKDDYTTHKNENQKNKYITRYNSEKYKYYRFMWSSCFWSRWLLWNKTTIDESVDDLNERFYYSNYINHNYVILKELLK